MLRLIVNKTDLNHAVHAGGEIVRTSKTFDVDLPELEAALNTDPTTYITVSLSYEIRRSEP